MQPFARIRVGAHKLAIETGVGEVSVATSNIVRCVEPYCQVCRLGAIESERHFVHDCSVYSDLRTIFHFLFEDRGDRNLKAFLDVEDKYAVGKFVHLALEKRASIVGQ